MYFCPLADDGASRAGEAAGGPGDGGGANTHQSTEGRNFIMHNTVVLYLEEERVFVKLNLVFPL